ncbi:MAG: CHASE3 domain-containing protein, partial [Gammaproteobacteria bacterium]
MALSKVSSNEARGAHAGPPLPPGAFAGFVIAVVAVVVIAFFSYQSLLNRSVTAERVTHTLEVILTLEALNSTVKDAETGQRGFLLTGDESYLEPYNKATAALQGILKKVRALTQDNPQQLQRLEELQQYSIDKMAELAKTIELRRSGATQSAQSIVRSDRGKVAMDRILSLIGEMEGEERGLLTSRQAEWAKSASISYGVTGGGSFLLLALILASAVMTSRDYRNRQTQVWLRTGQVGLSTKLQGEQRLDRLGENVLTFLADYLDARAGAIYIAERNGQFRRFASYAAPNAPGSDVLQSGQSLLGQAAKENRAMIVQDVPQGYLQVASSLGAGTPRELLMAPASVDGVVQSVMELAFFRTLTPADRELLDRVSESVAAAVRASKDRTRLEELLQETQRQAEELQTQQEELRVSNEELEEQSRALQESQVRLETGQAELEQTNSQLEEQTQLLEIQKDGLTRTQSELTEKAEELERSNQYKSEFLANMSHELRTPLNSSLILAKILADNKPGNLTEEQVKFAKTITSAGKDLLALINDILDLSKIEAGKVEVTSEPVSLVRMVDSLTKTFQPMAQEKHLGFSATVQDGTQDWIETDSQRLGQILKNLLSNAVKFTERGDVSLHVYKSGSGTVAFMVRDSGIGIPPDQQNVIFEAFRQADGSTHRRYGGTGLGLSISRDLARLLGGDIVLQSTPGTGSVFTLTLPETYVARPEARAPRPLAEPPSRGLPIAHQTPPDVQPAQRPGSQPLPTISIEDDRNNLKPNSRLILIVEDDQNFAAILRDMAREMGFQCVVTHTAGDGLNAAAMYGPSAILLDMNLPDHSGLGVLDQLKRNPQTRHIPVHVASVADYQHEALALGAVGYALKPVKREQLVEALEK